MNLFEDVRLISPGQPHIVREMSVWLSRLHAGLDRLRASWMARRQRAREMQELHAFSDKELWDLGLGRSDVFTIANGTYRRE
ncbi:MAG: DUF1127 domain-containing protein [Rhodopila sp.]|nr:DUF1127 domain-containing protein [Rhodopila sp.]